MIERRKMGKKSNKKQYKAPPAPLFQVRITALSDGSINVMGFPKDLNAALSIMDQGKNTVVQYFIQQAKENRLNDRNVVDGGNIIVPKKGLLKLQ